MTTTRRIFLSALALSSAFSLVATAVFAAPPTTGQALEIAPPVLNIKANPGETIKTTISLRDVSTSPLVVRNQVNDFVARGEDGTPKILLDNSGESSPYSLKTWVQPMPQFTLKPKEVNQLPLTIHVPKSAAPGGYYAVIRFTASPPGLEGSGVSLSASLGTLVLLRVNGDAKEAMSVAQFSATKNGENSWLFESPPIKFVTRIRNDGSTHEQPTGQIAIKDMFGNAVANVNVNLTQSNVLPGSVRRFEPMLDSTVIGNRMLFGRFTADLKLTYGANGQTLTSSTSFWIIPYKLIAFTIILLLIAFIVLRIGLRRYNERLIERSRSRRRRR